MMFFLCSSRFLAGCRVKKLRKSALCNGNVTDVLTSPDLVSASFMYRSKIASTPARARASAAAVSVEVMWEGWLHGEAEGVGEVSRGWVYACFKGEMGSLDGEGRYQRLRGTAIFYCCMKYCISLPRRGICSIG